MEGTKAASAWKDKLAALDTQLPPLEAKMDSAEKAKEGPEAEENSAKESFDNEWNAKVSAAEDEVCAGIIFHFFQDII